MICTTSTPQSSSDRSPSVAFVLPAFRVGGLEVSMLRIAGYFKASGWQVTMVTTEEPGPWFHKITEHGLGAQHIAGLRRFNYREHAKTVGEALAQGHHDVVFTVFDRFSQAALSYLQKDTLVASLLRNDHPDVYDIGLAASPYWDVAVGNSPKICQTAQALVPSKPIWLIPNGVSSAAKTSGLERHWAPGQVLNLLFVGRLVHESKRVLMLPDMMHALKQSGIRTRLRIVGEGPDREALVQRMTALGVAAECELAGKLEGSALMREYATAHALIFCSVYEGLPNVLLEAMSHGCIPVATRLDGITDYVISDGLDGFLVPVNDAQALAQSVARLATSDIGERMSLNARNKVLEHFSREREADQFMRLVGHYRQSGLSRPSDRPAQVDSSLFPPSYAYRRVIRPYLVAVYKNLKRWISLAAGGPIER